MASLVKVAEDGLRRSAGLVGCMTPVDASFETASMDKGINESAIPVSPISIVSTPASVSSPSADSGASQETEQKIVSFHAVMSRRSYAVRISYIMSCICRRDVITTGDVARF
jgi:hypothetical protein